jgi:hypothetical protein
MIHPDRGTIADAPHPRSKYILANNNQTICFLCGGLPDSANSPSMAMHERHAETARFVLLGARRGRRTAAKPQGWHGVVF